MAGKETFNQIPGPMIASDEMVQTWISKIPEYNDQGKQAIILNFDFQKSGEKMVFVVLPENTSMKDLVEVSVDEQVMRFSKKDTQKNIYVNPILINNDQAIRLRETGYVDRLKVRFPPRPIHL